jgi:hypothetical protein
MTRRQWTGLAGVLFGIAMFVGVILAGTTPNSTGSGAIDRYTDYWSDSDHQDKAAMSAILHTYAWVLLVVFAAGLRSLLSVLADGVERFVVLAAGAASAALFGVGAALVNAPGVAAAETGYEPDGNQALLLESVGYYALSTGMMMAAAMAVAFGLANRRARIVPQWTLVLTGLFALVGLGSIFVAWVGFMLLPLWAVVMGGLLLLTRGDDATVDGVGTRESVAA